VFLYPLLIIAFTHNTLSGEQEQGVWTLLCSQPISSSRLLAVKAVIRFLPILLVWLLTLLAGLFWLRLPLDQRLAFTVTVSLLYLLFWFAASWLVMSFERSSNFNALSLLGTWLTLTILIPAALNVALSTWLPVPEALAVTVNQREGYHQQWDRPKTETMLRFFQRYPKYASFQAPADKFSWGWYFAAQHLGDEEAAPASKLLRAKLAQRQQWMRSIAWLVPTINAQFSFNQIAHTELENHLAYLDSVRDFHAGVRDYFYPAMMRNDPPPFINWSQLPRHEFNAEASPVAFSASCLSLFGVAVAFGVIAQWNLRRKNF
jgi:ABC-2 type transport system permease protein